MTLSRSTPGSPTRRVRQRSPRKSARSSRAPMRSRRLRDRKRETMTPTAKTATAPAKKAAAGKDATPDVVVGRVARVIGPVVDIEFPSDAIPEIYSALTTEIDLT